MTTLNECANKVAEELGLDQAKVRGIAERLQAHRRKAAAAGLDPDAAVADAIRQDAGEARIRAAKARKTAALNVIKGDAARGQLAEINAQGLKPTKSLMGLLNGVYGGWKSGRDSVANRRGALEGAWRGGMLADIQKTMPHVIAMMRRPLDNVPFWNDVVREWRQPGSTKSKEARQLADIFTKYTEAARIAYNKAGGNIGKILDWGGPQSWDPGRMIKVGQARWVQDVLDAGFDSERSFGALTTEAEVREILADVYTTITTGVAATPTARERGAFVGDTGGRGGLEHQRVLHFKNADAWLTVHGKYGRGNVVTGLMDHLSSMARATALMEKLGPNPKRMFGALIDDQRRQLRDSTMSDTAKQKALDALNKINLDNPDTGVARAWAVASGDIFRPGSLKWAQWSAGARAVQGMAKLGLALPSQFSDLMTYAQAMRWQGRGLLQGYADAIGGLLQGRPPAEIRHIALLNGVGADTFLGGIHGSYGADDAVFGWLSRRQEGFFKLNGMHWWTDNLTTTFAAMSSVDMAHQSGKAWEALNIGYRTTLAEYGIGPEDWGKIRNMVAKEGDYSFIWPELAGDHELEMKLRGYMHDTATFAVINGDDRTKQITTGGQRRGTPLGEAVRFMMQFKSFPVAYTQKFLMPMLRGAPGRRDLAGIPHLIAMSLAFGYVAQTFKDYMKNKTPRDPRLFETWMAAFLQSGGGGIYGDFLFGNADRMGGGFLAKVAGPFPGVTADLGQLLLEDRDRLKQVFTGKLRDGNDLWGDLAKFAIDNSPYVNLHFFRAALDLAILNSFQEWLSPGTFRRRERKMEKTFGQEYVVDPLLVKHGMR